MHPGNRRPVHANGPVEAASLPCHSPARRRIERWHSGQAARLFAPASHRHLFPRSLFARLCSFTTPSGLGRPRKPWPICRCAWRCACTAAAKSGGDPVGCRTLHGYSRGTRWVLAAHSRGYRHRGFGFRGSGFGFTLTAIWVQTGQHAARDALPPSAERAFPRAARGRERG